jgi:hypothetical protein
VGRKGGRKEEKKINFPASAIQKDELEGVGISVWINPPHRHRGRVQWMHGSSQHDKNMEVKHSTSTAGCTWLMPVILATCEAEIQMFVVQTQPRQIVCDTLFPN